VRFERHPSQVVFDPSSSQFVVTWSKCGLPESKRLEAKKDPNKWMPSVMAMASLYDRGCLSLDRVVYAANAIGRAFDEGDREGLDTEGARKAAELVRDLSTMCGESSSPEVAMDVGQAMRHLLDEIAAVRFSEAPGSDFMEENAMPALEKATDECFLIDGFLSWTHASMRRRFLFCIDRKYRTDVVYTLVSMLFEVGTCPLLSIFDRRMIRMGAMKESGLSAFPSPDKFKSFFRHALECMREMKENGLSRLPMASSQQQFSDSVTGISDKQEKTNKTRKTT
jgi:hypothetical protein